MHEGLLCQSCVPFEVQYDLSIRKFHVYILSTYKLPVRHWNNKVCMYVCMYVCYENKIAYIYDYIATYVATIMF